MNYSKNIFSSTHIMAVFIITILLCCNSCNTKQNSKNTLTEKKKEITVIAEKKIVINYRLDSIKNRHTLDSFMTTYDSSKRRIIASMNRITPNRFRVGMKLIMPDTILSDFMQYSPFPVTLPLPDSIQKFVLVNQRIQLFAAYENGKQVRFGPVSTGRKTKPTPNGLFYTNYKSKLKTSTVNGEWKMPWYFNISNNGGIGMHQFVMPGYPASHSCIRMYEEDAFWLFNWAEQWQLTADGSAIDKKGTPVLVFGTYDFTTPSPWKILPENKDVLNLTDDEISTIQTTIGQINRN